MRMVVGLASWWAGCAPEYGLSPVEGPSLPPPAGPSREAVRPTVAAAPSSAAVRPERPEAPAPPRSQAVELGGDARTATADFLFVVDGSSSMEAVLGPVRAGIDALIAEGAFPADARIAVMSTLPADPEDAGRVHPAVPERLRGRMALDPGFLGPVDADRLRRVRAGGGSLAGRFPEAGCDAWFSPDQRDRDGVPCLVAHTRAAMTPVMVEAGLTALGQRLDQEASLFRSGAAVNVIFVSDTHDPGLPPAHPALDALVAARPTGEELAERAARGHELASFRLHAIAPAHKCSPESWGHLGPAYFEAAEATGGRTLDLCGARPEDYVALIRSVATEGAVPTRPVVALTEAAEVASVTLDGAPVGFSVTADGRAVLLDRELPARRSRVEVRYQPRPVAPVAPVVGR